ncbi:MAG TPA: tRNA lysidine(34) synthetase TilS [Mycobacteriales bacterium]|nr:tRNA lysidine(34) synthetase TilS [Mycobacteriales bacterium]
MTGPHPAVAATRVAVRRALASHATPGDRLLVACSGGADSLALAAALAFEAPRYGVRAGGVCVDHGLQDGSAHQAEKAAGMLRELGLGPVFTSRVQVSGPGGPEAAARAVRYAALDRIRADAGARWVLLGHTLDDQAESVLLGLGRGSGPRSIAGMRTAAPPWLRPLLGIRRRTTRTACVAQDLVPWEDPHNAELRFRRSRLRHEALPVLEDVLGGGVAEALARTADLVRADLDALAEIEHGLVQDRLGTPAPDAVPVTAFDGLPEALRRRLLRAWLADVPGLTSVHLTALDHLLADWHGQGPVALPRGLLVARRHDKLLRTQAGRGEPPRE